MDEKISKRELKGYVQEQLDKGYSPESIIDHLSDYGHSKEAIEAIFEDMIGEEEKERQSIIQRSLQVLYIVIFVLFMFWVGVSADAPNEAVLVGFVPTILYIVIIIILVEKDKKDYGVMMSLPVALAFLFYIVGALSAVEPFIRMDIGKISLLNIILSYLFFLVIYYSELLKNIKIKMPFDDMEPLDVFQEPPEEKISRKQEETQDDNIEIKKKEEEAKYIDVPAPKPEPLDKLVHSIEANSKALNMVIGRVYRKSNNGTKLMREVIQVKSDWYNEFNLLTKTMDKDKILAVVDKIEKRLNHMFRTEEELFGKTNIKNLKRDSDGRSRVIDVLIDNDSDPVEVYFENALISCGKVRDAFQK